MFKDSFNRTKRKKYLTTQDSKSNDIPAGIMTECPKCKKIVHTKELAESLNVCFNCDHHVALATYKRIEAISDGGSFTEFDEGMASANSLDFPSYLEKIEKDQQKTGLKEAVVTGAARLDDMKSGVVVMGSRFRMGSMRSVIGEKIYRIIDRYTENRLPFILFSASGGARIQEGTISLMQMGKASVSLKHRPDAGLLYISYLTHPTTGGASVSFASVGDINLSEPRALIGFVGRRVIEQTINGRLPDDFQATEFLLEHEQLGKVVHRNDVRQTLSEILKIHQEMTK